MKGFAKIFEAIIASIIVLTALTFFFVPNPIQSGWDRAGLQVVAQDTLKALYINGVLARSVKTDNRTEINVDMASMLPKTVDFSIEVSGVPNDIIYVACVDCSSIDELIQILSPLNFQYKDRNISIRTEALFLGNTTPPSETNILFFFDKEKIIGYQGKVDSFLGSGGTVFLLSDLTESDVQGVIGQVFNLTWIGPGGGSAHFYDVFNASVASFYAGRYFANLTNRSLEDLSSVAFPVDVSGFHNNGVLAVPDAKNIAVEGGGRAYVRANFTTLNNPGRSVWFSDYNRADHDAPVTMSIDNLLKAAIMWGSGERFRLDLIKKEPAQVHLKTGIFIFDGDPYLVELTIWSVFF